MTVSHKTTFGFALISAIGLIASAPAIAQEAAASNEGLASTELASGNTSAAIQTLTQELRQYPKDPALMINLGIAHAQSGNEAQARDHFEAAMASRNIIELDTANGNTTNSRALARTAIAMLERGEFRPAARQTDRFTLRE